MLSGSEDTVSSGNAVIRLLEEQGSPRRCGGQVHLSLILRYMYFLSVDVYARVIF